MQSLGVKRNLGTQKEWRVALCVDYRKLSEITVKNSYPLPRIYDILDNMAGSTVFSSLDLSWGYHQVELDEKSKEKTTFITTSGLYQFKGMPFGRSNAPATFEALVNKVLRSMIGKFCLVYIDDIIIYSKSKSEHYEHLEYVFELLKRPKFTIKEQKYHFFVEKKVFYCFCRSL